MSHIHFLPIRHHSPSCAYHVQRAINQIRPSHILIEGPSDANPLIPHLLEEDLQLPVAIYSYKTSPQPERLYYPICDYSPEFVAIFTGSLLGAHCSFIDIPSAWMMETRKLGERVETGEWWARGTTLYMERLAQANGFDTHEEFWEARFEIEGFHKATSQFFDEIALYGSLLRELEEGDGVVSPEMTIREEYMAWQIQRVSADGAGPVVVLCGAAHLSALQRRLQGEEVDAPMSIEASAEAETTLIPYSYHRLSEQSGYGAGNTAPRYYQLAWEKQGDFSYVSKQILLEQLKSLRKQGNGTNLSHAIEAGKLAHTLSVIRGKSAPGVKEIQDATISCYGEGHADLLHLPWRETLIGAAVGVLPQSVKQTPLQQEFYLEVQRLGIPLNDMHKSITLQLTQPSDQAISVFLHRLRLLGSPFSQLLSGPHPHAYQLLTSVREKWEVVWTPAVDSHLIEQSAFGSSLAEVCSFILQEKCTSATRVDEVTEALLTLALTELPHLFPHALDACENMSSEDRDFIALCQGVLHLSTLLKYGTACQFPYTQSFERLLEKLILRAIWSLLPATVVRGDGVKVVLDGLQILYDVLHESDRPERSVFVQALNRVFEKENAHPLLRGFALSLQYLLGAVQDRQIETILQGCYRTSARIEEIALFIQGLFRLNRAYFIRKRGLIQAIHLFVMSLDKERFIQVLPMLRQVFTDLTPMDGRHLATTLRHILEIEAEESKRLLHMKTQRDHHLQIDQSLAAVVERWRTEYGLF